MEQDNIFLSYNILKTNLEKEGYDVVLGATYVYNQKRYYFDLLVNKANKEIAIFEFKSTINWNDIPRALYEKCKIYSDIFQRTKPIIFISDGDKFAQYSQTYGFDKSIDFKTVVEIIKKCGQYFGRIKPQKSEIITILKGFDSIRMTDFINDINSKDDNIVFYSDAKYFYFQKEYEKLFFKCLLGDKPINSVYRYTSINTLFKTLTTKKQSMSSILGMDDKTESYYADHYLSRKMSDKINEGYNTSIQYQMGCFCFILSCVSDEKENINMWDQYGDSAKGVRIKLTCTDKSNNSLWIAPISYAKDDNTHPEIDLLAKLRQIGWNMNYWNIWQHFFKPNAFQYESEVRLMYICNESVLPKEDMLWVHKGQNIFPLIMFGISTDDIMPFPYSISKITMGPLSHNQEMNKEAIKELILSNQINVVTHSLEELFTKSQIQIDFDNYIETR